MEYKNIQGGILDVDDKGFVVKVAFNKVGIKDYDNDVIAPTAFNKTIKERGPEGSQLVYHLVDHDPSLKSTLGKPKELGIENGYLYSITPIVKTTLGEDIMKHYLAGTINQHSVGFSSTEKKKEKDSDGEYTLITQVKLYEGSAVLWGANPNTPTLSVSKSYTKKELADELDTTLKEYEKFSVLLRKGTFTDEHFGLIEIHVAKLNDKIKTLFDLQATRAVEETPAPDDEKSLDGLNNFLNILNLEKCLLQ